MRTLAELMGKKIRTARKRAKLTQEEIAQPLGMTGSGFAQIERGENLVSLEHLVKLPAILGVPITELLPDSVVTDYDRARARDENLQTIIDNWVSIDPVLRAGMDVYSLQRLMGHSDLSVLRRYLAQTEDDLREAHQKAGVVDRWI